MALDQYSVVTIRVLTQPADAYDGWGINKRSPVVGDVGTIVDVLISESRDVRYVVEAVDHQGSALWLAEFLEHELAAKPE